jgi:hypothetical protein
VGNTSHPSGLLRNLPLNGRFTPDMPFPNRPANDKLAAEPVIQIERKRAPDRAVVVYSSTLFLPSGYSCQTQQARAGVLGV